MLRAAAARVDISPPQGCVLGGGAFGPSVGLADPLGARALYLHDGTQGQLVVVCDLLALADGDAWRLRRRLARRSGLPVEAVLLATTHTHNGPCTLPMRSWGSREAAYLRQLGRRLDELVDAVRRPRHAASLRPARVALPELVANRRRGHSTIDGDLRALLVEDQDGGALAVLVNHACHAVSMHGTGLVSGDYPAACERALQRRLGPVPVLYLAGAAGDINPAGWQHEPAWRASDGGRRACAEACTALGDRLAAALDGAWQDPLEPRLGRARRRVLLPLQALPPRDELRAIAERCTTALATATPWQASLLHGELAWTRAVQDRESAAWRRIELQWLELGGLGLLAMPVELFATYGLALHAAAPEPMLLVTLANGYAGYVPTPDAFGRGSYEACQLPRLVGEQCYRADCGAALLRGAAGLWRGLSATLSPQGAR